jgi:heme-degrading monooxygenase HmoA
MSLATRWKNRRRAWLAPVSAALVALAAIAGLHVVAGCQVASPFRGPGFDRKRGVTLPDAGNTVTVGITHAILAGDRSTFDDSTRKTIDSLPTNDGFIGFSVRSRVFGNEVWTMTAWRDEASLDAFVASPVHRAAMRSGLSAVARAQFLRLQVPKETMPLSWDEVLTKLENVPFVDYAAMRDPQPQN